MLNIQPQVSLREYTTFHIGGSAEYFVAVTSVQELRDAFVWARERSLLVTILGGGSNVFVSDEGVHGLVVQMGVMGHTIVTDGTEILLTVAAGEVFDEIVAMTVARGWWGLENLSCIPGSVGATPIQNIGAYGVEINERIVSVMVYDPHTDVTTELTNTQCAFGYRDSLFKHAEGKHYVVTAVTYRLSQEPNPRLTYRDLAVWSELRSRGEAPTLAEIRTAVCEIRSKKFPDWNVLGTAGSFFKNPIISEVHYARLVKQYPQLPGYPAGNGEVKIALGWILDHVLNVRGFRQGAVGTYEGQALVIVNHGDATAIELETFAAHIVEQVRVATNITIAWEVTKLS